MVSKAAQVFPMAIVMDVESIGLHGEGFAVAYVVVSSEGKVLEEGLFACDPSLAQGTEESRKWVSENVPMLEYTFKSPRGVRDAFWAVWLKWRALGAYLVAEGGWPVEARFLAACVDDCPKSRGWEGPFPLVELSSMQLLSKGPPLRMRERLNNELPVHNPLADARHSARLWLEFASES